MIRNIESEKFYKFQFNR